jgi:ferric-dicitrate binding protein FerR (iron transport regulator)
MKPNNEHIRRLLVGKIAGTNSETENQWIEQEILHSRDTKELWQELCETMHSRNAQSFLQNLNAERDWVRVEREIKETRSARMRTIIKWSSVAAVFILGVSLVAYLYSDRQGSLAKNDPSPSVETRRAIELQLANGRRINLSDTTHRLIDLGDVKLNTSESTTSLTSHNDKEQEWSVLEVPAKLDYKIVLTDGTEVWLNSASNLRFPMSFPGNTREVYLHGEAFFKVAKNQKQPFVVHTGQTEIKVLGTSFNVDAYDTVHTVTSLVEGAVLTREGKERGRTTTLKPGLQAVYSDAEGFKIQPFKAANVLSWMQGVYYFHDTPLQDIAEVLHRWFEVKVVFDNPELADLPVTGDLEKGRPLQLFLSSLQTTAGINAVLEQGVLHLK